MFNLLCLSVSVSVSRLNRVNEVPDEQKGDDDTSDYDRCVWVGGCERVNLSGDFSDSGRRRDEYLVGKKGNTW